MKKIKIGTISIDIEMVVAETKLSPVESKYDENTYNNLVVENLNRLWVAVEKMLADTYPSTSFPEVERFNITPDIIFPGIKEEGKMDTVLWGHVTISPHWCSRNIFLGLITSREVIALKILKECEYQPQLILEALHRIQAAASWCNKKADERHHAAREMRRQQMTAMAALELEKEEKKC